MSANVFATLSKYGSTEAENYLTESLVLLLRVLLERSSPDGIAMLNSVAGPLPCHPFLDAEHIRIRTQVTVAQGRPDIEITESGDTRVYVEIKHDSPLGARPLTLSCINSAQDGIRLGSAGSPAQIQLYPMLLIRKLLTGTAMPTVAR